METSFTVSSANLATATAYPAGFEVRLVLASGSFLIADNALINGLPAPLTGTTMGTTCFDLTFRNGGASFLTATPPYAGVFKPYVSTSNPTGSFVDFIGQFANGEWWLPFSHLTAPASVDCWVLKLTVS